MATSPFDKLRAIGHDRDPSTLSLSKGVGRATHGGILSFNATAHPGPTRDRMLAKLWSDQGRAIYARRKVIAEPPFGQIQEARGFRRFSLRGLIKTRWEWGIVCLTHNLLKLFRNEKALALSA